MHFLAVAFGDVGAAVPVREGAALVVSVACCEVCCADPGLATQATGDIIAFYNAVSKAVWLPACYCPSVVLVPFVGCCGELVGVVSRVGFVVAAVTADQGTGHAGVCTSHKSSQVELPWITSMLWCFAL